MAAISNIITLYGTCKFISKPATLSPVLNIWTYVADCFDVEYIYGFVRWGGLQAKSMTSQRGAFKMADMRYYGNVMTTTRWLLYVNMETL